MYELKDIEGLARFLGSSYTAYQAVEHAAEFLSGKGFERLLECENWRLEQGKKYFVTRGGALIAFLMNERSCFKIVASHTDSPSLKLKEHAAWPDGPFTRLNVEPYGGGIFYSLLDRPLKIAGRVVKEKDGKLNAENFVSENTVVIPSLAIHMDRTVNEKFSPDAQKSLSPLYSLGVEEVEGLEGAVAYDLFAAPAEQPFVSGKYGEFLSSPRIDNLTSVAGSLASLAECEDAEGISMAVCFNNEEVGSRTLEGAGSDFLRSVLSRILEGMPEGEREQVLLKSFLLSLDNAHSVHPNYPEKCDPTNRAVMGGGIILKSHAGGAYITDALSAAVVKRIFSRAGVKYQTFYNRSNMRSGGTLGPISIAQVPVRSADLGLAQLAMHSAVETFAHADYLELLKGLAAFYGAKGSDLIVE